jgi:hypothetical protein
MIPVYITVRDRVSDLRLLVEWLERVGHDRITLLDNASTWAPLLDYLDQTPHEVIRLGENLGARALWLADLVPVEPFVLTDPDILPTDDCPLDLIKHLHELQRRHSAQKVGVGLYLDDLSPGRILDWERSLVAPDREIEPGVYDSLIDTTLAVYAGGTAFQYQGLRTSAPYQARHLPWYRTVLDEEHAYYLEHATPGPHGSSWKEAI